MAGRKPRVPRDEQAGVTPLHGPRHGSGIQADGTWVPEFPGQKPPFAKGNRLSVRSGAQGRDAVERAAMLMNQVIADPDMPAHLKSPAFSFSLQGWARVQAAADLYYEYAMALDPEEGSTARRIAGKAPLEIWLQMEKTAATMRKALGMDPTSYAKIMKDLGLQRKSADEMLKALAGTGAQIVARRRELGAGTAG